MARTSSEVKINLYSGVHLPYLLDLSFPSCLPKEAILSPVPESHYFFVTTHKNGMT